MNSTPTEVKLPKPATGEDSSAVAEPQMLLAFKVGDRTRAKVAIYEGPDDYAPGGYLCRKGDLLIVRKLRADSQWPYAVSHEDITDNSFSVASDEIELDAALDASRALATQEAKNADQA